jgi:hypothetical protein
MEKLMNKFNKLPEWVRWILFLPISSIASIIFGIIMFFVLRNLLRPAFAFFLWENLLNNINADRLIYVVLVNCIFLFAVFFTIPRWKWNAVILFVAFRSLFLVLILFQITMTPYFISNGWIDNSVYKDIYNWQYLSDAIGEVLVLITSIMIILETKKYDVSTNT